MSQFKLIIDRPVFEQLEYVVEEKNSQDGETMYVKGVYAEAERENKNKRKYRLPVLQKEVERYVKEQVDKGRGLGELNHPTKAEVDLERASHMVVEIKQQGNQFIGKSKVLSTPCGQIARNLIRDGASIGMSTRSVGRLVEGNDGINEVEDMRLIAVDMVADPSCPSAFINGILESKHYILSNNGEFQESYENLELGLSDLPRKDLETYLQSQIMTFLEKISSKS